MNRYQALILLGEIAAALITIIAVALGARIYRWQLIVWPALVIVLTCCLGAAWNRKSP